MAAKKVLFLSYTKKMIMPTVKRGLMLDFAGSNIDSIAKEVHPARIFKIVDSPIKSGDIIYLATRDFRLQDNWAVVFGLNLARVYDKKFKIIVNKKLIKHSKAQENILAKGLDLFKINSEKNGVQFEILDDLPQEIGALLVDFNPINPYYINKNEVNYPIFEIDSHNIIPARFISEKQEFSAAHLRRKVYSNIATFLTEFPISFNLETSEVENCLNNFINNKLNQYSADKNDPNVDGTSNLSPYLHFGFISAQRVALEVIKSNASRENKEAFLEELIVRKELSDNFCLYNKDYNNIKGIPDWAKETLDAHKSDIRSYTYTKEEFETAKTHDIFWNAIQKNLVNTGKIHGYLRMYWAKKILEWAKTPEDAIDIGIYLNDKHALDGNNPNGYVGVLWSVGGLHDRPFANRFVTGKIRYMSEEGCRRKFDVDAYINKN